MQADRATQVIVNADDLGLTTNVTRGILDCFTKGIVRSASLMVNMPATPEAVELARQFSDLALGIHLNLTLGKPVSPPETIPTLVTQEGSFYPLRSFVGRGLTGRISSQDIYTELSAQLHKFLSFQLSCQHIDMHRHVHVFPHVLKPVVEVARKNDLLRVRLPLEEPGTISVGSRIPIGGSQFWKSWLLRVLSRRARHAFIENRIRYPDLFCGIEMMDHQDDTDRFMKALRNCKPGVNEVMCHPGYQEESFCDLDGYDTIKRYNELKLILDPGLGELAEALNIQLVSYAALG